MSRAQTREEAQACVAEAGERFKAARAARLEVRRRVKSVVLLASADGWADAEIARIFGQHRKWIDTVRRSWTGTPALSGPPREPGGGVLGLGTSLTLSAAPEALRAAEVEYLSARVALVPLMAAAWWRDVSLYRLTGLTGLSRSQAWTLLRAEGIEFGAEPTALVASREEKAVQQGG